MADRRPLAAAVNSYGAADLADVRAFITQERPVGVPTPSINSEVNTITRNHVPAEAKEREVITNTLKRPPESLTRSPKRKPTRLQPVGLIPVTIRPRPEIAGALKRASLERQLGGEEIFTQQDLVESALEPWLIHEGYMSSKS